MHSVRDRIECNRLRLDLALTLLKKGDCTAALSVLESAVMDNVNPDDALLACRVKLIIGDTLNADGKSSDALIHWQQAAAMAENDMYPLERCAGLVRIASVSRNREKEEYLLRAQSILHRLDLEELSLERII